MANVELYGKDDPLNEYRIFRTNPGERCGFCAFMGKKLDGSNYLCVKFRQPTNPFAGCNKFLLDKPMRQEDKLGGE